MKYYPFFLKDLKSSRSVYIFFEIFFWPVISLITFGIFANFFSFAGNIKIILFTGTMTWSMVQIAQLSVSRGFLVDVWESSLKHVLTAPVTLRDFVIGHWMYGILAAVVGFTANSLAAYVLFGFNILQAGMYLPLVVFMAVTSGLIIGVISLVFVLMLGLKVDVLVWAIVEIILFFSGLYYSTSVFPPWVQAISHSFPLVYMLEGLRSVLMGVPNTLIFAEGIAVMLVWVLISLTIINKVDRYAKKTGFYQRYG